MEALIRIQKELKVPKGQFNKFGGYKYRSAEDIEEAVKPWLQGAILTLSDEVVLFGSNVGCTKDQEGNIIGYSGRVYIKSTATLSEGDKSVSVAGWAREQDSRKGMDSAQVTGSASSYARKMALGGLFLCADTPDPDRGFSEGAPWDTPSQAQRPNTNGSPPAEQPPATAPPPQKGKLSRPTPEERKWFLMLWDYYVAQAQTQGRQLDNKGKQELLRLCDLHMGHYPNSMNDVERLRGTGEKTPNGAYKNAWIRVEELFV